MNAGPARRPAYAAYPSLAGRTAFITGGGGGIGAALTEAFCRQGARVAFVDIDVERSRGLVDRLADGPCPPLFLPCDITDIAALREAIAAAGDRLGPIGVLVNNAGNDQRHALQGVTPECWDERMAVNLRHQFFAAQAVQPQMQRLGGGAIINFSSTSWVMGEAGYPCYTTAKAAIVGLTRSLARELGGDGIRVNAVLPGWIMTERQLTMWIDAAAEASIDRNQSLKVRIQPADVARLVLFLAADDSCMCTGQQFIIDAGWV
jgi:NAD(P)-dependent dehydrogenase (short-subunit alcohol dehydrogenase family)